MDEIIWQRPVALLLGALLGTGARLGLLALVGHEPVALGALSLVGCFLLGAVSGFWALRVRQLGWFLAGAGLAAFTSWSTLVLGGIPNGGAVVVAVLETAFGAFFAGLGHLLVHRRLARTPDLDVG